jgi:tetratricopeptide (TPR) repeat protein
MKIPNVLDNRVNIVILLLIFLGVNCGGGPRVNTDVGIPALDASEAYDSPYVAGWEKLQAGKAKEALESFQQSRMADDKLHVGFGYTFLVQNKFRLARQNFDRALELNPNNVQAQMGIASIYETMKEMDRAFKLYARLRVKFPENPWIKARYEYIKSTETEKYLKQARGYRNDENAEKYIDALEKAAHYSPEIVDIKLQIADSYYRQEQYKMAAGYYEKVLEVMPDHEDVLYKLANVFEKMKAYDSAVVVYKKLLELKPGDIDITNRINDLKVKFYDWDLPVKFKNIFFKNAVTREDLAALIGYYFDDYLKIEGEAPVILTDIGSSYAREYIIKVCTLGIMEARPDHSFGIGDFPDTIVNHAKFAEVIHSLIRYLERTGRDVDMTPRDRLVEPTDISPLHKHYKIIKYLVNSGIIQLDAGDKFNPTANVSPSAALVSLRKLLRSLE